MFLYYLFFIIQRCSYCSEEQPTAQGCGQTEKLKNKHHSAKKTSGKTGELIQCVYLTAMFMFICFVIFNYNNFQNI